MQSSKLDMGKEQDHWLNESGTCASSNQKLGQQRGWQRSSSLHCMWSEMMKTRNSKWGRAPAMELPLAIRWEAVNAKEWQAAIKDRWQRRTMMFLLSLIGWSSRQKAYSRFIICRRNVQPCGMTLHACVRFLTWDSSSLRVHCLLVGQVQRTAVMQSRKMGRKSK